MSRSRFVRLLALFVPAVFLGSSAMAQRDPYADARNRMVDREIVEAGVKDERVLQSMRTTPRHAFVRPNQRQHAYFDAALPIGDKQTISPPSVVAFMTEQLDPQPTDSVLEIGTGSGYQAAVLSPLVREVYTIEIVEALGRRAEKALTNLKYKNVHCKIGDGYQGWPEHAPFDKIIVTCSPESVPGALAGQLKEGGRMIIPVGERYQQILYLMTKRDGKLVREKLVPTLFVPMTGAAESRREKQPDPAKPEMVNGGFEETLGSSGKPSGWHCQRQLELIEEATAPAGTRFARFHNTQPGVDAQALQGFAVDGRKVSQLRISMSLRGEEIRPGQLAYQNAMLAIVFYDADRKPIDERRLGPWRGTFAWRHDTRVVAVPPNAREAIIRVGLLGATGTLDVDAISLQAEGK